jgi:predicted amidohydrolase YtcJ
MNPDQPLAEAMAVERGRIVAVGSLAEVEAVVGDKCEFYDLNGATVVPGFIETHDHLVQYGGALSYLDITPFTCPSLAEALAKLKAQGEPNAEGWIYAWAADQTLYTEKRGPTRQELDELFPDTPVFIFHMSGHGAYVNSRALEAAGVTKDTPDPPGGTLEKDDNGELTGYLNGMPAWLMVGKMPAVTKASTFHSAEVHAQQGFTTVSELSIMNSGLLQHLKEVTSDPDFPVRIMGGLFVTIPSFEKIARRVPAYETELFKVPFVKTWTDGSTQGGTGYFHDPFHKLDADTKAGARGTQEQFNAEVTMMLELGFAPAIHTNGDAAMDLAINALAAGRDATGRDDIRPHLIHCQYVRPEQFDRIRDMGNIGMTFMSPHVYFWGDMHRDVLIGPERARQIAAVGEAIKRDIPFAIHNDPPVTPPHALHSMWVAVNRLTSSGQSLGSEYRITPQQALAAYTSEAAKVFGLEDQLGSLEVGKHADFVVLAEDPLEVDPMTIKDIKIKATIMGGKVTHRVFEQMYSPR